MVDIVIFHFNSHKNKYSKICYKNHKNYHLKSKICYENLKNYYLEKSKNPTCRVYPVSATTYENKKFSLKKRINFTSKNLSLHRLYNTFSICHSTAITVMYYLLIKYIFKQLTAPDRYIRNSTAKKRLKNIMSRRVYIHEKVDKNVHIFSAHLKTFLKDLENLRGILFKKVPHIFLSLSAGFRAHASSAPLFATPKHFHSPPPPPPPTPPPPPPPVGQE